MLIIGHRGAAGLAPENTIASIKKALEHGVDMVEFDLRVTKDEVVILHHDPALTDPNGQKLNISDRTYSELKKHKADLATFEQVLEQIGDQVPLYVEIKPRVNVRPIIKILSDFANKTSSDDQLYLASKSQSTLKALHVALPELKTIVIEPWSGVRATYRARELKTKFISMNQRWLWSGFIIAIARNGYQLYAYTLNDRVKAKRWEKAGLAGVVTDYPDRFDK